MEEILTEIKLFATDNGRVVAVYPDGQQRDLVVTVTEVGYPLPIMIKRPVVVKDKKQI